MPGIRPSTAILKIVLPLCVAASGCIVEPAGTRRADVLIRNGCVTDARCDWKRCLASRICEGAPSRAASAPCCRAHVAHGAEEEVLDDRSLRERGRVRRHALQHERMQAARMSYPQRSASRIMRVASTSVWATARSSAKFDSSRRGSTHPIRDVGVVRTDWGVVQCMETG
jgi:hypothetical protein